MTLPRHLPRSSGVRPAPFTPSIRQSGLPSVCTRPSIPWCKPQMRRGFSGTSGLMTALALRFAIAAAFSLVTLSPAQSWSAEGVPVVGMVTRPYVDKSRMNWSRTGPRPLRTAIWYPVDSATKRETIFGVPAGRADLRAGGGRPRRKAVRAVSEVSAGRHVPRYRRFRRHDDVARNSSRRERIHRRGRESPRQHLRRKGTRAARISPVLGESHRSQTGDRLGLTRSGFR